MVLFSHSKYPYKITRGDKIATVICEKIYYPELDLVEKLDDTWRGARGFGSTGLN
jgi:dUTP pyrophosphatase